MDRRSRLEVAAVIATGMLRPVLVDQLQLRGVFIALVLFGWATYATLRIRAERSVIRAWGFTNAGLGKSSAACGAVSAAAVASMLVFGLTRGSAVLHWHMALLLLLYPIWGLLQQFLIQGIVVRSLATGDAPVLSPALVTVFAALLFCSVHLPDLSLTAATFAMGLLFTPIYLRWRNLWPLGFSHGVLGVLFYFWVLGRDPLAEIIGGM